MARERKKWMGALNVKIHRPSARQYAALFRDIYRSATPVKIRGSDWGLIGTLETGKIMGEEILYGRIFKFLNIDPRGTWLDLKKLQPLDMEKEGALPPVPDNLKPNLREVSYVLYPGKHRLFFGTQHVSPGLMRILVQSLCSELERIDVYGEVDVVVESTREVIQRILSIPSITRLDIFISKPNPEDFGELEQHVRKRIEKQNLRTHRQISTSTKDEGIQPDQETIATMNVARSNGKVIAEGYEADTKVVYSTEDHPLRESFAFDPDRETELQAMIIASVGVLNKIMRA